MSMNTARPTSLYLRVGEATARIVLGILVLVHAGLGAWALVGPRAMLCVYAAMAAVCAYQTFFILTHPSRFRAMAIEYLEYALILAFLFFSPRMRRHFSRKSELPGARC